MNTFEDRTKGFEAKFKQDADLQFKLSAKRNKLIGQLVEIRADAKTKSKDAVAFSLRFPRFKCFRGFKAGEKV